LVFSPADQHAQPADLRVADLQASTVAVRPDQLLVERRHQLAMMIENCAVGADQQVCVPQAADGRPRALGDADRYEHGVLARGIAKLLDLRARHLDRIGSEAPEVFMIPDRRLHRGPDRKPGHERLRECDEPHSGVSGLRDE